MFSFKSQQIYIYANLTCINRKFKLKGKELLSCLPHQNLTRLSSDSVSLNKFTPSIIFSITLTTLGHFLQYSMLIVTSFKFVYTR